MEEKITLPPRLTMLGVAMRTPLERLEHVLLTPVKPRFPGPSMKEVVPARLDALSSMVLRMETRVRDLMAEVVDNNLAGKAQIYRAVGRFESVLDELLDAYREVGEMQSHGGESRVQNLLVGVFRHSLKEIRDWLAELVAFLTDPRAALEKQEIPQSGKIELTFALKFTPAPQLAQIVEWAKNQAMAESDPLVPDEPAHTPNPREPYWSRRGVNSSSSQPSISAYDFLKWGLIILVVVVMTKLSFIDLMLLWLGMSALGLFVWLLTGRYPIFRRGRKPR